MKKEKICQGETLTNREGKEGVVFASEAIHSMRHNPGLPRLRARKDGWEQDEDGQIDLEINHAKKRKQLRIHR